MQIESMNEITVSLINSILARIDSIETFSFTTWVTIAISFIAIVISIISFSKNNSVAKDNALENIKKLCYDLVELEENFAKDMREYL